jgi:S1-C subfamily serine protease
VVNVVDWVLVGLAVVAAVSGWRQGLVGGVLSFAGFLAGAAVGVVLAPRAVNALGSEGLVATIIGVAVVVVCAGVGNALAGWGGRWVRDHVTWTPARLVDSATGSLFGVLTIALVAWLVASAVVAAPLGVVTTQVRGSKVLGEIDAVMPPGTRDWVSGLRSALDSTGFPQAFSGFTLDPVIPVAPPDPALLKDPAVRAAWNSLVKVEGVAPDCGTQVDGSGFVFANDHVMTNAHVVAGVDHPSVTVRGVGRAWPATVVYLDAQVDVAVLYVPGLDASPLAFASTAVRGDPAVVVGFPGGGPLTATAARIRARLTARGSDIYGAGTVSREVYSIRGEVKPGNSGGPLLAPDGHVYGVVFAVAVNDPQTGYALTASQVAPAVKAGSNATEAVATGSCNTR